MAGKEMNRNSMSFFRQFEKLHLLEPRVILLRLSELLDDLLKILELEKQSQGLLLMLLKVLSRALKTNTHRPKRCSLMEKLLESKLFSIHFPVLLQADNIEIQDLNDLLRNLLFIFRVSVRLKPFLAATKLCNCVKLCMSMFQEGVAITIPIDVQKAFTDIECMIQDVLNREDKKGKGQNEAGYNKSPSNFGEMQIIPTTEEITSEVKPFHVQNIDAYKYKNINHYVGIHFHLLREHFVAPLREAITAHSSKSTKKEYCVYSGVKIREPIYRTDGLFYEISFDVSSTFGNSGPQACQRLIPGSLLCLSEDNFQTILYATVSQQDSSSLMQGKLIAKFETNFNDKLEINEDNQSKLYEMVESSVCFESYRNVLKGLQMLDSENILLKEYIVDVQHHLYPPQYLDHNAKYDFSCVLVGETHEQVMNFTLHPQVAAKQRVKAKPVVSNEGPNHSQGLFCNYTCVLDFRKWPSCDELNLDNSQWRALQFGLTSSLSIIRGLPGTGKTHLGHAIVKILLHNQSVWRAPQETASILLIFCTTHALEQFLGDIILETEKLVYLAGRSKKKSFLLDRFNIHHSTQKMMIKPSRADHLKRKLSLIKGKIAEQQANIQLLVDNIIHEGQLHELTGNDKQLLDSLTNCLDETQPSSQTCCPRSFLVSWLGLSFDNFVSENEIERFLCYAEDGCGGEDTKTQTMTCNSQTPTIDMVALIGKLIDKDYENDLDRQLLTDDSEIVESRPVPINREAWALHIPSLANPFDHFPDEKFLDGNMISMYLVMGRVRKVIAEREMQRMQELGDILVNSVTNAWLFPLHHRWSLYRRWVTLYRAARLNEIKSLQKEYDATACQLKDIINEAKLLVLQESHIIATTISEAALQRGLLQQTGSKIVIVQEAADILESQLIAILPPTTEHLVLIGDYQQSRPKVAMQDTRKDCNLKVSLFERLVRNGVRHETLEVQHRIRPEILNLICPRVYPEVECHSSVQLYKNIEGLCKNVFFINHEITYVQADPKSPSPGNQFEAEYLLGLCAYLIQQGYEPQAVTILTFCTQQLQVVLNLLAKEPFIGVTATTVDSYKGQENDVILVSVASNNYDEENSLLNHDIDVITALTRARKGLYCFGNFSYISSDFWHEFVASLLVDRPENIGSKIELKCQMHPNYKRFVACREDFKRFAPHGGCLQICSVMKPCGHICQQICHLDGHSKCTEVMKVFPVCNHTMLLHCSQNIAMVKCKTKVRRVLINCGHTGFLECHIDVTCHKCTVKVKHVFPRCQHQVEVKCSTNRQSLMCQEDCDYRLDCGHQCPRACHSLEDAHHIEVLCTKPCQKKVCNRNHKCKMRCCEPCNTCHVMVDKELLCGHTARVVCHQDVNSIPIVCRRQCSRILSCGHPCKRLCKDPCGGCEVLVEKIIPKCNHITTVTCMTSPERAHCVQQCKLLLACGHACTNRCCDPCIQQCQQLVSKIIKACGHTNIVSCYNAQLSPNTLTVCQAVCSRLLPCEHKCKGTCSECWQGRVHVPCSKKCDRIQICGHQCGTPCSQACMPCKQTCQNRCLHSRCRRKCGQPCKRCWEPCEWHCPHFKCDQYCSEFCTRPRCNEPCTGQLPCGHACIGLCGEKCPTLCRICDIKELTEFILFGYEEDKDSRFIQLEDCGHCIEVRAMDHWMDMDESAIQMKGCPRCKTTIWRSRRYGNVICGRMLDVQKVKKKLFGSRKDLRNKMDQLQDMLRAKQAFRFDFHDSVAHIQHRLNQPNVLHQNELVVIENQINMLEMMMKMKEKTKNMTADAKDDFLANMKLLGKRLMQNEERITEYELNQINCEIRRIFLIAASKDTEAKIRQRSNSLCTEQLTRVKQILDHGCALTEAEEKEIEGALEAALRLQGGLGISYQERVNIVTAMGFQQGHWFKCPNGHIYAIGECGGAMQVSNCNECGAQIGGQGHQLLTDNAFSSEMDGSSHPAWPGTVRAGNVQAY